MKDQDGFIKAYHEFRRSVDFAKGGIWPELDNVAWCMIIGVPCVPADEDSSEDASLEAIDQRVAILKAVFVEVNRHEADHFLDQGLIRYDQAGRVAKKLLKEANRGSE